MRSRRKGIAVFEWILLLTLFVIGIVSGLAVIRDATIVECAEVADAILHHNKSYMITSSPMVQINSATNGVIVRDGIAYPGGSEIVVTEYHFGGSVYTDYTSAVDSAHVELQPGKAVENP